MQRHTIKIRRYDSSSGVTRNSYWKD